MAGTAYNVYIAGHPGHSDIVGTLSVGIPRRDDGEEKKGTTTDGSSTSD